MKMDSIYVVMPAYNEEENIEAVVRQWYPVLEMAGEQSRLVIADNGSKDATHEILMKLKESMPQLEILEKTDRYHGPKVIALYKYAIKNGADYIFQTDSDGQTNPEEFAAFWQLRCGFRPQERAWRRKVKSICRTCSMFPFEVYFWSKGS